MSVVAKLYRGNLVDVTHIGHIAVVDYTGKILYHYGNPERVTFARSSAKPIQAIPCIESGAVDTYNINDKELALFCASHSGEDFHTNCVKSILSKAGLNEEYLQCGTHYPLAKYATNKLIANNQEPQSVHCNCSGKHSGMLITAKFLNEDLNTYFKEEHPVQKRIIEIISDICDYNKNDIITAIDGCGVPVHALPLYKFAQGYARLSKPELFNEKRKNAIKRITNAMTSYPEMVGGTERLCSDLMRVCGKKLFAKTGSSAYYAIGLKDKGIGLTFKMEDGNSKIISAVILETLKQLDIITNEELKELDKYYNIQYKNHKGEIVGHIETSFELIKDYK